MPLLLPSDKIPFMPGDYINFTMCVSTWVRGWIALTGFLSISCNDEFLRSSIFFWSC